MLIPVFFLFAFAVTYGVYAVLGYLPENNDAPAWADLVAAVPGIALLVTLSAAAVLYGVRAIWTAQRWGLLPLIVGAIAGLGFTIMSLVTILTG